jgi:chemotaxis family two-component system sensor kinase Cph1
MNMPESSHAQVGLGGEQPSTDPKVELERLLAEIADLKDRLRKAEKLLFKNYSSLGDSSASEALISSLRNSGLRQIEEELVRANQELARSNLELEQFASNIAHDLRTPLISISGCARLLLEVSGNLIPEERELAGYIEENARLLGRMVQSLLEYARAGQGGAKLTECPMDWVLSSVADRLQAIVEETGARITRDPLPVVFADPMLIGVLLQNLIENAIKYRSERPPEVHISAAPEPGYWKLSVRDNGIGIAAEHYERVFQLFQRLHWNQKQYPGMGVGLATCKRIAERHGGRIWVESKVGEGTTFYFTVPQIPRGEAT